MNVENWMMPDSTIKSSKPGRPNAENIQDGSFRGLMKPLHSESPGIHITQSARTKPQTQGADTRTLSAPRPAEITFELFEHLSLDQSSNDVARVQKVLSKWNSGLGVQVSGHYDGATRDALTLYKSIYGGEGNGSSIDSTTARHLRMMEDGSFWQNPPTKNPNQELLYHASRHLGKPYVLGGDGIRSTDCGMLTSTASKHSGFGKLSRLADMQYLAARNGKGGLDYHADQPESGDLVFYRIPTSQSSIAYDGVTHVSLYVNDGLTLVASPGAGKVILQPISQLDQYVAGYGRFGAPSLASR